MLQYSSNRWPAAGKKTWIPIAWLDGLWLNWKLDPLPLSLFPSTTTILSFHKSFFFCCLSGCYIQKWSSTVYISYIHHVFRDQMSQSMLIIPITTYKKQQSQGLKIILLVNERLLNLQRWEAFHSFLFTECVCRCSWFNLRWWTLCRFMPIDP